MANYDFDNMDLIVNASARVPLCICVDTSFSMTHKDGDEVNRFDELVDGIRELMRTIEEDEAASSSVEVAVVGFNKEVKVLHDFATFDNFDVSKVKAKLTGASDLGLGVLRSLELLDERKKLYKENHVEYYRPWLLIMTDGQPWGDQALENLKKAQEKVRKMEKESKITVLCILCGGDKDVTNLKEVKDQAAIACLQGFTENPVQNFSGAGYRSLFRWLSRSMSASLDFKDGPMDLDIPKDTVDWTDW